VTPDRLASRASRRLSTSDRRQAKPRAASRLLALLASSFASIPASGFSALHAQPHQEAPVVPSSTIGPVTNASTFSVLGVTALPDAGASMGNRNVLWLGATQPVGRIAGVRFALIGSGFYSPNDAVGAKDATEGTVSLRALARIAGVRTWSALSYGRSSAEGSPSTQEEMVSPIPASLLMPRSGTDTTFSRRDDVGTLSRAEVGMLTVSGAVEFSFGVALERATRVTTQRSNITESPEEDELSPAPEGSPLMERRDMATGLASASFRTGATDWLVSVTSPLANWVNQSSSAPRPQRVPTVASVAFVQPLTAWLSVIGAASTNATTVGSYAIRDDREGRRSDFAPVIALGVRIARFPSRNRPGEPTGILAFETRTVGIIDAVTTETLAVDSLAAEEETGRELVRVLLIIDAPRAESVELMGDATGWSVTSLSRARDGKWRAELRVPVGMHRVAVRADGGTWIAPPGMPMSTDDFGGRVGLLVVKLRSH
jgi:hypothetical protein